MSSLETWPQELADFALVSKDGKVLSCHKARLVENSEYFRAMLSHKMRETSNNQMDVPEYDGVTVASFLEWVYAPKKAGEKMTQLMLRLRYSRPRGEFISQRQFDEAKFTPGIIINTFLLKNYGRKCEEDLTIRKLAFNWSWSWATLS